MKIKMTCYNTFKMGVLALSMCISANALGQNPDPIIQAIIEEGTKNSQLHNYSFELLDEIGPRLVGTPQMMQAHNWVVDNYKQLGFDAYNQEYGTWKAWERGPSEITMLSPRVKSLEGTQLAWSPSTGNKGIQGEVIILEDFANKAEFEQWLKTIKGKIVLMSMHQKTGRPDYQWKEFSTPESYERMVEQRKQDIENWNNRIQATGYTAKELPKVLEQAGASGIVMSFWTGIMGANRIFGAETTSIPTVDLAVEDYGLLYRLAENGKKPVINITAISQDLGTAKTYNTIAELKGGQKKDEYVILSAHLDSWDGGSGATDNGTGIIAMLEASRILSKVLPNPKRTLLVGNWGSEEQGLNGSRAFVEDNPDVINNIQVVFNQDNGTGRVVNLGGEGFLNSYQYLGDWLEAVPQEYKKELKTNFPGNPSSGGSDQASFVAVGAPAHSLGALHWGYGGYTWHTNRDTADKIVYDDLQNNAILIAILAYKALQDENSTSKDKRVMPLDNKAERRLWPTQSKAKRE
ncbi:M20/M25/M40 family metallo-hydrolase [Myroides sp. LJL119]